MSAMGVVAAGGEQLMLLRALRDVGGERSAIGNGGGARTVALAPKTAIGLGQQQQQQQQQRQHQQAYDPARTKKQGRSGQPAPIAVAKRNARERNRVKQVNNGFATLRQHIPSHVAQGYGDRGKKLSKVETLRMAVEYIRGLQRLLAEADHGGGLGDREVPRCHRARSSSDSPTTTIPSSPSGSAYSSGGGGCCTTTHNGDLLLGLDEQQQQQQQQQQRPSALVELELGKEDERQPAEIYAMEEDEAGPVVLEEEEEEAELAVEEGLGKVRKVKIFWDDGRADNRLSENQNRDRLLSAVQRRHRNSPVAYFVARPASTYGDEENIEPLINRNSNNNNNNSSSANNNNLLLGGYSPILLHQSPSPTTPPPCVNVPAKPRELRLPHDDEAATHCSNDDEVMAEAEEEEDAEGALGAPGRGAAGPIIASSAASPYSGEILIESPETGRLVPLKLEEHEDEDEAAAAAAANGQLVYLTTSADGLPGGAAYFKHELAEDAAAALADSGPEFMDVVSWWEQEQGRIVQHLQGQHHQQHHQHHHHHHHHHQGHHLAQQHHQAHHAHHHQPHQQIAVHQHRLAHV